MTPLDIDATDIIAHSDRDRAAPAWLATSGRWPTDSIGFTVTDDVCTATLQLPKTARSAEAPCGCRWPRPAFRTGSQDPGAVPHPGPPGNVRPPATQPFGTLDSLPLGQALLHPGTRDVPPLTIDISVDQIPVPVPGHAGGVPTACADRPWTTAAGVARSRF